MDKKLNRKILFNKSSQRTIEPADEVKPKMPSPKNRPQESPINKNPALKVVKWINDHEFFKWSSMCIKIGFDKSNFNRILKSPEPNIPDKYLTKIVAIIKHYGYAE